jgi:hypothetical protein
MDRTTLGTLIKAVCAVTTDRRTLEVAEWATMRPGGRAEEFLHYYLAGSGFDKSVDIPTLLREDDGVRQTVEREISAQLKRPMTPMGVVPLPQPVFSNRDWRYATGSLNMNWKQIPMSLPNGQIAVELSFRNQYRWHPNEQRITQCVHQAAENLKQKGAKDFWMVGHPTRHTFRPT